MGWMVFAIAVIQLPLWAIVNVLKHRSLGLVGSIKSGLKPNRFWGPKNAKLKAEWVRFKDDIKEHRKKEAYVNNHSWLKQFWYMYLGRYQNHFVAKH